MAEIEGSPFRTIHIFFVEVDFSRPEAISDDDLSLNLSNMTTEVAYGYDDEANRHNINLRVTGGEPEADPLTMSVVTVGVFEYRGEDEASNDEISEYANQRLLPEMTSRLIQLVAILSTQMGMPPVWLPIPHTFSLSISELMEMEEA